MRWFRILSLLCSFFVLWISCLSASEDVEISSVGKTKIKKRSVELSSGVKREQGNIAAADKNVEILTSESEEIAQLQLSVGVLRQKYEQYALKIQRELAENERAVDALEAYLISVESQKASPSGPIEKAKSELDERKKWREDALKKQKIVQSGLNSMSSMSERLKFKQKEVLGDTARWKDKKEAYQKLFKLYAEELSTLKKTLEEVN